jgi:ribosomal protein L40E
MNAVAVEAIEATFQGVICRNCGKSIRLSAAVIQRRSNQNTDLVTKAFSARCRRCHKESLYTLTEIEDIPIEPKGDGARQKRPSSVSLK